MGPFLPNGDRARVMVVLSRRHGASLVPLDTMQSASDDH
jgi:hypothetical protein